MYYYRGGCKAPFEKDKWHGVRLRITARAVTCWIDGQERFSRDTAADTEKGIWDDGTTRPLAIFSWNRVIMSPGRGLASLAFSVTTMLSRDRGGFPTRAAAGTTVARRASRRPSSG